MNYNLNVMPILMLAVLNEQQVHETLNWAFAAALSAVLLAATPCALLAGAAALGLALRKAPAEST